MWEDHTAGRPMGLEGHGGRGEAGERRLERLKGYVLKRSLCLLEKNGLCTAEDSKDLTINPNPNHTLTLIKHHAQL